MPAIPAKPVPRSNIVAGSGIASGEAEPLMNPCTVVIPLLVLGGTRAMSR